MDITEPLQAFGGEHLQNSWVREGRTGFSVIDREEAQLAEWAARNGKELSVNQLRTLLERIALTAQGNEHDVILDGTSVVRFTNGDKYGIHYRSPSEYLDRWDKFNRLFPEAAVTFEGFLRKPNGNGVIVTRQPLVNGRKGTPAEIRKAMAEHGFLPHGLHAFREPETGLEIHDAHEDNVIFDKTGQILPIDVWVNDPQGVLEQE